MAGASQRAHPSFWVLKSVSQLCCFSSKLYVSSVKNQVVKVDNSRSWQMEYTPGQAVEQLVLHVVHQAGGGGSLPLGLFGDVQAARSWFCFFSQDGHPLGGDSYILSKDLVLAVQVGCRSSRLQASAGSSSGVPQGRLAKQKLHIQFEM